MTPTPIPAPTGAVLPPDWSQFIPDIVSGLLTSAIVGFVVGVLLWRWQSSSESRLLRRVAVAEWRTKRSTVAFAVRHPLSRREYGSDIRLHAKRVVAKVLERAQMMPIGEWSEAAPGNAEIAALEAIAVEGPTLQRRAEELHALLEAKVAEEGTLPGPPHTYVEWMSAKLLGNDDPGALIGDLYRDYPLKGGMILAKPEVAAEVRSYLKLLERVEDSYEILRESLLD